MEPFGKDWEKSVMRLKKSEIMRLYRDMCIEKLKLEKRIKEEEFKELFNGKNKEAK